MKKLGEKKRMAWVKKSFSKKFIKKEKREREKRDTGKKEKKGKKGDHCQTAAAAQD
jgi:hypothetical protein